MNFETVPPFAICANAMWRIAIPNSWLTTVLNNSVMQVSA